MPEATEERSEATADERLKRKLRFRKLNFLSMLRGMGSIRLVPSRPRGRGWEADWDKVGDDLRQVLICCRSAEQKETQKKLLALREETLKKLRADVERTWQKLERSVLDEVLAEFLTEKEGEDSSQLLLNFGVGSDAACEE
jgi:hypothetical protein